MYKVTETSLSVKQAVRCLCTVPRPMRRKPSRSGDTRTGKFVDFRRVRVIGGNGGDGAVSFLQLWCNDRAGPDGGDGGNGGHVIFQASAGKKSLEHVQPLYRGDDGVNGSGRNCFGKNAEHTYVLVPVGTMLLDMYMKLVADLARDSDYFVAARGGAGGKGNSFFATSTNQSPRSYELGGIGEQKLYHIELRTMANVGLVGFPNAGKSTLLRAISRARPKVAAYPFTTLNPHVGIVQYDDHEQIAVADIPGIIEGSHENKGLGLSFLRHIERCTCLLYVLDLSEAKPWKQLIALQYELEQYQQGLSKRPHAIVGNKIDALEGRNNLKELCERTNLQVIPVSALYKHNIETLLTYLRELYDKHSAPATVKQEQL